MGVRFPFVASNTIVNATVVTVTETAVVTTPPINLTYDGALVLLLYYIRWTLGAGVTQTQYNLRRGTTAGGALVTTGAGATTSEAASASVLRSGFYFDSPGIVANQQYTLSLLQAGATTNATVSDVALAAFVL